MGACNPIRITSSSLPEAYHSLSSANPSETQGAPAAASRAAACRFPVVALERLGRYR